MMKSKIN